MKSMTGYGKGVAEKDGRRVTIEMKAVNHRYLDLLFKLPRGFAFCEDALRKIISETVSRGHIDVYFGYEDNREGKANLKVDCVVLERYRQIGEELSAKGFVNDITVSQLLKLPEVLTTEPREEDDELILSLIQAAAREAVIALTAMRLTEGESLKRDFQEKLGRIEELTAEIEERSPEVAKAHAEKLRTRIVDALKGVDIDENKLLNEVAFFVDKSNIDEELTRLKGHIAHARKIILEKGAVGKRLDFLVQEMFREVNTTGSKSNDLAITEHVLLLKNEVEKVREQVQNIE